MNCPEHLIFNTRFVSLWLYWRDVPRETIPLKVWLNPLRYEVSIRRRRWNGTLARVTTINREGLWWGRLRWVFVKHRYERAKRNQP